jgi:hypothetical protein
LIAAAFEVQRRIRCDAKRHQGRLMVRPPFAGDGLDDDHGVEDPIVEQDLSLFRFGLVPGRGEIARFVNDRGELIPRTLAGRGWTLPDLFKGTRRTGH